MNFAISMHVHFKTTDMGVTFFVIVNAIRSIKLKKSLLLSQATFDIGVPSTVIDLIALLHEL